MKQNEAAAQRVSLLLALFCAPGTLLRTFVVGTILSLTLISPALGADDGSVADLLVVWTQAAENGAGGAAEIQALIRAAVEDTNLVRGASLVNQRIRTVHMEKVNYVETGGDLSADIEALRIDGDGKIDNVHTLRATYGADLVVMVINEGGKCGRSPGQPNPPLEENAFAVVNLNCIDKNHQDFRHTLAHEISHMGGAGHEDGGGILPDSRGHKTGNCRTVTTTATSELVQGFHSNPALNLPFGAPPFPFGKDPEPEIITPTPGATLTGPDVTFTWNPNGVRVSKWRLTIGSTRGADDIYDSGPIGLQPSHSVNASFPSDGSHVFVRLHYKSETGWRFTDAGYNFRVYWSRFFEFTNLFNEVISENPVTGQKTLVAAIPGSGISISHTGHADYRNFIFTIMVVKTDPAIRDSAAVFLVDMLTGVVREVRHGNGQPIWIRYFRQGFHAAVVDTGPLYQGELVDVILIDSITGAVSVVETLVNTGSPRQFGNFVEKTPTEWVFHFAAGIDGDPYEVTLESGAPCFGNPAGVIDVSNNASTLNQTAWYVANFRETVVPLTYSLTTNTMGSGSGNVIGAGEYSPDTIVALTATPEPDSAFLGFRGHPDCIDSIVTMEDDHECTAVFELLDGLAPEMPTGPSPTNGEQDVSLSPILSWRAAGGAISYDVYFGEALSRYELLPPYVATTTETSYDPGSVTGGNTLYNWKVVAKNTAGNTSSAIWSFRTRSTIGVDSVESGRYETPVKSKDASVVFVARDTFSKGDNITLRAFVANASTGFPVANATVEIELSGPESVSLTTSSSGSDGWAFANWQTHATADKKGHAATSPGLYTATVTNVTGDGLTWNSVEAITQFTLQ